MTNTTLVRQRNTAHAPRSERVAKEPELARSHDGNGASNIFSHTGKVPVEARIRHFGHSPATVWLTGLSGAGKSTIAYELEKALFDDGRIALVLDGDNIRRHLNRDLGFSPADRRENIRRIAEVARLMNDAGLIVIAALISPFRDDRAMAAEIIGPQKFVEVHVSASAEVCSARDPKGLYAKAHLGQLAEFTGVSSPYEAPLNPALALDTGVLSLEEATRALHRHLSLGFG